MRARILGIDPGTTATGVALLRPDGEPITWLLRSKGENVRERRLPMLRLMQLWLPKILRQHPVNLAVVEWQSIRPGDPRPNDILELCAIAGAAVGALPSGLDVRLPVPVQWKGSVSKQIHQPKVLKRLGLTLDSPCLAKITPASMRHNVVDALGLAEWGLNQAKHEESVRAARALLHEGRDGRTH